MTDILGPDTESSPLEELERLALDVANDRNISPGQAEGDEQLRAIVRELVDQWISNLPSAAAGPVAVTLGAEPAVTVDLTFAHKFVLGKALFGASTELTATGQAALVPSA